MRSLPAHGVEPGLAVRWRRSRALLAAAFGWVPGAVVLACVAMALVGDRPVGWWSVLPVVGALVPAVVPLAVRVDPPSWAKVAWLGAAGSLVLGAFPAYGVAGGVAALPFFLVAWVALPTGFLLGRGAYRALMLPLVAELGSTDLEVRVGVRIAVEHADLITAGATVGRTHLVLHARRHVPNSAGSPAEVAVPWGGVLGVHVELLAQLRPWLSLADGTPLLARPGPVVVVRTARGAVLIPSDDARQVAGIVDRRVRRARA
ncbi:hypothetical protein [Actinokineospora spheciospongiae]|uniref:hypothetical protein n=1 Tax=Actinokineospora spheciospongiae TaxID=909613 RepID=UPI000D710F55|nr:hypothetical protein [Actinokineospora spheciospongiae]PWW61843.1 hypothetical protein DFQ13_10690 [Actinokineospora spheciospongiae]